MLPLVSVATAPAAGAPAGAGRRAPARWLVAALALVPLLPAAVVSAADTKIGVIDSQRIFAEFQEARDAQSAFQQEMKKWQDDLALQEKEITTLEERIRSQTLLLSREKLDELQGDLEKKYQAYESAKSDLFDPTKGKAVARNKELSQPITDKIATVVERLGAEQGYTIIIDTATVDVVLLDKSIDLTDKVLAELAKPGK